VGGVYKDTRSFFVGPYSDHAFSFWLILKLIFLVIDLSYAVSRQEGIFGSPERPLSDLGLISYRSYWKDVIVQYILNLQPDQKFSIRELSLQSGILQNDLVSTLQFMQVCFLGKLCAFLAKFRCKNSGGRL